MTDPRPSEVQALAELPEVKLAALLEEVMALPLFMGERASWLLARGVRVAPSPTEDPDLPQWETCRVCTGQHSTADHGYHAPRSGVAPSPDAPGLDEAIEEIRWTGTDCPAAMEPESFYRQQLHRVIGIAARAALAASGDGPREGLVNIRLLHDLFAGHDWGTIDSRCPFRPACEWESDEAIVNQMEATEYASESHPTKERTGHE